MTPRLLILIALCTLSCQHAHTHTLPDLGPATLCAPTTPTPLDTITPHPAYTHTTEALSTLYPHRHHLDPRNLTAHAAHSLARHLPSLLVQDPKSAPQHLVLCRGDTTLATLHLTDLHQLPAALTLIEGFDPEPDRARRDLLRGLVEPPDIYTDVLTGHRLQRFQARLSGASRGLGFTLKRETDGRLTLTRILPDSPAAEADLRDNDQLTHIANQPTLGMSLADALDRLNTPDPITLTLSRDDATLTLTLTLTPRIVSLPNVTTTRLEGDIGLLHIARFSTNTLTDVNAALDTTLHNVRGLILDLRGNPGGDIEAAAGVADRLLDSGTLFRVVEHGRKHMPAFARRQDDDLTNLPLIILVDPRSASSSELLAGALRENQRAHILGSTTFGKGSVQRLIPIADDIQLKLTIGAYTVGPEERAIEGTGLTPDVSIQLLRPRGAELLPSHPDDITPDTRLLFAPEGDPILDIAATALRNAEPLEATLARAATESDARIAEHTHIDWSPGHTAPASPLNLTLRTQPAPRTPGRVELTLELENPSSSDVHRAFLVLTSDNPSWDGLSVMLGRIAAGDTAHATRAITLPPGQAKRDDQVHATLIMEGHEPLSLGTHTLSTDPTPAPRLALDASWDGTSTLQLELTSDLPIAQVQPVLAFSPELGLAIEAGTPNLPRLEPGGRGFLDFTTRTEADALELTLELRASRYGSLLAWPLTLRAGERVHLEAPIIELELDTGDPGVVIRGSARDDSALRDVTLFLDDRKIAWLEPRGSDPVVLHQTLTNLSPGAHVLRIIAADDQGIESELERAFIAP